MRSSVERTKPYGLRSLWVIYCTVAASIAASTCAIAQGNSIKEEARGPLELLKFVAKCPLPKDRSKNDGVTTVSIGSRQSLSNHTTFHILSDFDITQVADGGEGYSEKERIDYRTAYKALMNASASGSELVVNCAKRSKCIRINTTMNPDRPECPPRQLCEPGFKEVSRKTVSEVKIILCDGRAAADAADAINELIRLSSP
jgi:hypothetical protein